MMMRMICDHGELLEMGLSHITLPVLIFRHCARNTVISPMLYMNQAAVDLAIKRKFSNVSRIRMFDEVYFDLCLV